MLPQYVPTHIYITSETALSSHNGTIRTLSSTLQGYNIHRSIVYLTCPLMEFNTRHHTITTKPMPTVLTQPLPLSEWCWSTAGTAYPYCCWCWCWCFGFFRGGFGVGFGTGIETQVCQGYCEGVGWHLFKGGVEVYWVLELCEIGEGLDGWVS